MDMDWRSGGEPQGQKDLGFPLEMRREHSRQEAPVSRGTSWLLYLLSTVCVRRAGKGQCAQGDSSCPGAGETWLER